MDLLELPESEGERHPWEQSRARAIEQVVRASTMGKVASILDYGCGDAYTGRTLLDRLGAERLVGIDPHLTREQQQAFARDDTRIELTSEPETLAGRSFDLVLLCDVIEHVEDDGVLLGLARQHLSESGRIMITVPAFQSLFTDHDRALKHFRRYSLRELEASVDRAGLTIDASGYLFSSLLAPRALSKLLEVARGERDGETIGLGAWRGGRTVTAALRAALSADNALLLRLARLGVKVPGLSAWALCH